MAGLHVSTNCCRACNTERPIEEFYLSTNRYGTQYADNTCKSCRSKKNAARHDFRRRNDQEYRDKINALKRQYRTRNRIRDGKPSRDERAQAAADRKKKEKQDKAEARRIVVDSKPWNQPGLTRAGKFRLRYRLDPEFNLKQRIRAAMRRKRQGIKIDTLLRGAVKRSGSSPIAERFVGYTAQALRQHLERQFTKGMTWEKFCAGEIHIDHIVPLASHDISNPDELRAAWQLTNLRPLWARENIRKAAQVLTLL